MKVAILQKKSLNRQFSQSTEVVLETMKEAEENGADLLLLPEAFLTGYELPMRNEEALPDGDPHLQIICKAAKELHLGVVVTAITRGQKKPKNSAYVVDKTGTVLMKYSKVHTCDFADEACLESGETFSVCDFHGIQLGIMICYDREYPESARVLMLKGAEIILVPNDCSAMKPRLCALSTRAYENMVGIAMANPNGENAGNSCAFSPICWDEEGRCVDNVLLMADDKTEGVYYAEFDMDAIRTYRENEMMGNTYRKVKAYDLLLSEAIAYPFLRDNQTVSSIPGPSYVPQKNGKGDRPFP
ncbi:MAG: carbon-nitrogen hydrolase family protein [Faecousia sp.]